MSTAYDGTFLTTKSLMKISELEHYLPSARGIKIKIGPDTKLHKIVEICKYYQVNQVEGEISIN